MEQSMACASTRVSAGPTPAQWSGCRQRFTHLYLIENKTLQEVMPIIELEYGFKATVKMYKTKIGQWGLDKNLKRAEVLAMLRKKRKRSADGKDSIFMLRDRLVDERDIERYAKRNRISLDALNVASGPESSPATPEALICSTPPAHVSWPLAVPEVLRIPEKLLFDVALYIRGCFETSVWRVLDHDHTIQSSDWQPSDDDVLGRIEHGLSVGCLQFIAGRPDEAGLHWRMAFKNVDHVIRGTYYQNIYSLVCQICRLHDMGFSELAKKLQEYLAQYAKSWYPSSHPTYSIYVALAAIDLSEVGELEEKIRLCFANLFEAILGARSYTTFVSRLDAAARKWDRSPSTPPEQYLPDLVELDTDFGVCDKRSLGLLYVRAEGLLTGGFYIEAELTGKELIRRAALVSKNELRYKHYSVSYYFYLAWCSVGHSQIRQGKDQAALESLQTSLMCLDETMAMFPHNGLRFRRSLAIKNLEELASTTGRQEDAAKWHAQRRAMIRTLEEEDMEELGTT